MLLSVWSPFSPSIKKMEVDFKSGPPSQKLVTGLVSPVVNANVAP